MPGVTLTGTSWWLSSLRRGIPRRRQNGSTSSCRWFPPSHHTSRSGLNRSSPHRSHLEREIVQMLGKLIEWKIGNPPHPPELLLCLIYGVLMICTISVLISMRSSPTGGSMSPPTILCMTRQSCAKAKRPSNSDIICVCWPILSPHLRSGWGIVMSISVLCANTSEELMCALRKAGGGWGICFLYLRRLQNRSSSELSAR